MTTAAELALAVLLALAAALKLRDPLRSATALAVYGVRARSAQRAGLAAITLVEVGLAAGLVANLRWAAWGAGALFAAFALAALAALLAGRAGLPCACFGARSRLGWHTVGRSALAAALALAVAARWLPSAPSSYDRWLTVGLVALLAALAALAVVVLALARELGVLRLALAGQGALELPDEGPRVGDHQPWSSALPARPRVFLGLAVFSSPGCPVCQRVAPAIAHVAADPLLAVRVFDELTDAATWTAARVPGSPYAVALDAAGVALAKGTFNNLVQLESIVATARARQPEFAVAA